MSQSGFRSTGMTNVATVARIEPPGPALGRPDDKLSEIRDHPLPTATPPRVSLTLNPGYGAPATLQIALFLVCTIPFWTSNVIRTISWIPLLGRNGLVNSALLKLGIVNQPIEWLIYSDLSVILSLVHLYVLFMIVPIFNSMMRIDRALLEASCDAGASGWQTLWNVVVPLSKPGIAIGSIFVITIVMGDFVTVGVM